jgi:hypothetical protein
MYYGQAIMCIGKFAILHAILVVHIILCSTVTTCAKIRKVEKGKKIIAEKDKQISPLQGSYFD